MCRGGVGGVGLRGKPGQSASQCWEGAGGRHLGIQRLRAQRVWGAVTGRETEAGGTTAPGPLCLGAACLFLAAEFVPAMQLWYGP